MVVVEKKKAFPVLEYDMIKFRVSIKSQGGISVCKPFDYWKVLYL